MRLLLMPAIGFIFGCGFFAVVGAILLSLRRRRNFSLKALLCFVPGAMVASAGAAWLYRLTVADFAGLASEWCRRHRFLRGAPRGWCHRGIRCCLASNQAPRGLTRLRILAARVF
jgi:hypothetical protein